MKAKDLKNSILQLAIQGKLVPQDPKDEPASKLLEKIRAAKQKLVKEGKIKKDKQESFIYKGDDNNYYEKIGTEVRNITGEIPFEIPDNWAWVRLQGISNINGGFAFKSTLYNNSGVRVIRISDFNENGVTNNRIVRYPYSEELIPYKLEENNILLAMTGGTVGKSYLVEHLDEDMYVNQRVATIKLHSQINAKYINAVILSNITQRIIEYSKNSTNDNISMGTISNFFIPLPPMEEQKHIVKQLEILESYIEKYDKAETELSVLNETFPDQIKKAILQYAIQGKLVPQDPNDEPASILLDKIKAEKQKLIKAGKIKKDKQESYIYKRDNRHYEKIGDKEVDITDEIPFEIPNSWVWVRLGNVMEIARGGSPRPIQNFLTNDPNGINWIKIGDTDKTGKYINSTKEKIIPEGMKKSRFVHKGDFLLTNSMSFGRPYILNIDGCIHDGWLVISNIYHLYNLDYLYYLLASPFAYSQFSGKVSGAVVKNLNSDKVASSLFPLPPLQEQKKIATKIEQIFKMLS